MIHPKVSGISFLLVALMITASCMADKKSPPLQEITGVKVNDTVWRNAKRGVPVELRSKADLEKYFTDEQLTVLFKSKNIDLQKQYILLFAWRGSGQDKMTYAVAESSPEQIKFTIVPGRTRDLRPHLKIYVLRNDVKYK